MMIVDDHKLIREMLVQLLSGNSRIEIIGESGEFDDAIEMIRKKKPDIVLLDISLPKKSGFDAVPVIREVSPDTRIIIVSMHDQPAYAKKMLKLGAKGYITKSSSHKEMLNAVEEVLEGRIYICAAIKDTVFDQVVNEESGDNAGKELSYREIGVMKLLKIGLSSKEIAAELGIAVKTVEVHRYHILKKMKIKNTASLINFINTNASYF